MGIVKLAGVAVILLSAQVYADSIVNFGVELSPLDAQYVQNYKSGARTYFTTDGTFNGPPLGNPADGQQYPAGGIITWDITVAVDPDGLHNQPGHPSNGYHPAGVANLVFNLQLENNSGQVIVLGPGSSAVQGWYSAIYDGLGPDPDTGGAPVQRAAAFTINYNVAGYGPGRVVDLLNDGVSVTPNGGPALSLFTFPTLESGTGKLLGEGGGYTAWKRTGGLASVTYPGVGLATIVRPPGKTPATVPGLDIKAVCEGQLNTAGLPLGTYKLRVVPGAGVNVLRGDLDLYSVSADSFAVAANVVNGDDVTFQLVTPGHLAVDITPPEAVTAGAQFAVDGGFWQNPGTIDLAPGDHTVSFKAMTGYATPANVPVTITAGATTPVTGNYTATDGTLTVSITPSDIGGQYSIDGGATWRNPGQIVLTAGDYPVSFKPVAGYTTPASQNVTVTAGADTPVSGVYTSVYGTLTIVITPPEAIAAGAMFSVDDGANWYPAGTYDGLDVGEYSISFSAVAGYTTPDPQTVTVNGGQETVVTGAYTAVVPPVLTATTSMRTHGSAGSFGLPIALSGTASVECRQGGPQQVVLTYDKAMTGTPAVTLTATGGAAPTLGTVTLADTTLTVNMSGAVDKTCITVAVAGIGAADGSGPAAQTYVKVTCRFGDVDGNHAVQAADVSSVKSRTGLANVTASNFWYDIDCNGKIQAADVSLLKAQTALGSTTCAYP